MPRQKSDLSESDLSADSGTVNRRKTGFLPDGAYFFEDELNSQGVLTAKIVTGAGWLLEFVEIEAGEIFFASGSREIRAGEKCIAIFYAPFSILQPVYKNVKAHVFGIASLNELPAEFSGKPFFFKTTGGELPSGADVALTIIQSATVRESIEFNPQASLLSRRAKKLIDENYLIYPSIARVAVRLNVSHEHLTRQFKLDFGLTPSAYLRQIRIADAPLRLARGEEIIDVSQMVGYNDLSRFYKQFRQTNETSPGACQTLLKPAQK